ncbi:uncharacterized protein [Rutidosis leptorrhynchoides]|uniref:uncharacterized protein n=1 Tax=Rutidosis leptorrhynchoides TaxID=125765 RepID=UPI003A99558F
MVASLPAMKLDKLYENPFICEAILSGIVNWVFSVSVRSLPPLAKKYVLQMLYIYGPVTAELLEKWVLTDGFTKHKVAIDRLIQLRVFTETFESFEYPHGRKKETSYRLNSTFQTNLQQHLIHGNGNETDRLALLEFKKMIVHDPLGIMLSWNTSTHFCQWHRVTCGRRHQRVIAIDLGSQKLTGSISSSIGNMSFLRFVSLENNSFNSHIPSEIGYIRRLKVLSLHNNSIGGSIPSNISSCSALNYLSIHNNNLEGEIPWALGNHLPNLVKLTLYYNKLTGMIPPSLGNLSSLSLLSIGGNNLIGAIPRSISHLKNLYFFNTADCRLEGIIHPSIFNLTLMQTFDVASNGIQGNLPSNIGITLPNLQWFSVAENNFTGNIPVSLSNASNIELIQVHGNKFSGGVPSLGKLRYLNRLLIDENLLGSEGVEDDLNFLCSLANGTNLEELQMSTNNFGGPLPQCMSKVSSLNDWLLQENRISGNVPTWIGNLTQLERLAMSNNPFSGQIPSTIGRLNRLYALGLYDTNVQGNIPTSFGNLSQLNYLLLFRNNLHGSIPPSLSNCTKLFEFDISENNLSGTIPSGLIDSHSALYINVSNNILTGPIPSLVGNLNLQQLDVSRNMLSGEIPSTLGRFMSLEQLFIQQNSFNGKIPSSLSSLRGLQFADFSSNNLSGEIPDFLSRFELQYLNLSNNNFEGEVPTKGVFTNASLTSIQGNGKLCGGIIEFQLPKCQSNTMKKSGLTRTKKLIIYTTAGIFGVLLISIFPFLCLLRKKRNQYASKSLENSLLKVSYKNLIDATEGFSSTNLVGVGSFGSVYKGIINQETTVAVKVFDLLRKGASKSFIVECEALRNIRHRNLVKVITACSGVDYRGNDFKAIVYDFMVNGSLEDWLHPPNVRTNEESSVPKSLNLLQRLSIAIDVACAIEYLHHNCETAVVHCDLKPSNVLLDEDMTGHVGDFGLAKLLSDDIQNSIANSSNSFGFRGTVGYAPPEYGIGNEVSIYGDVYSYGILLLEMFTGKRPTSEMFKEGLNLRALVEAALPENVAKIADPVIVQEISSFSRKTEAFESLISLLKIGIVCSAESTSARMNMIDVVAELCSIRNKFVSRLSSHHQRQTHVA